jgi:ribosome-binding factor A
MDTTRQNKVSRLIQKELSDIFQKEAHEFMMGNLVTITLVRITPDLSIAKSYISVFPSKNGASIIEKLEHEAKNLRLSLSKRLRHQLRTIPELKFFLDDSLDYVEKIDKLLKQ